MKLFTLAAAGIVALTGLAPTAMTAPAAAQHTVVTRTVVHTERHDRGPRYQTRRVCHTERHHGRRVQVCRTVRR